VAAPTGSAAFQVPFGACAIHRLIHWRNPRRWAAIDNQERLHALQASLRGARLFIFDELSTIGRQFLAGIDSRLAQAFPRPMQGDDAPSFGQRSVILCGDPAQCAAIFDHQPYDPRIYADTPTSESRLTNKGLMLYREFDEAIVLTTCHRVTLDVGTLQGEEASACKARAQRFLELLHKVRDLTLSPADYFELCKRKRAFLSLKERQSFEQSPVLMDFRKDTAATAEGNCELYNRRQVRALARRQKVPVIAWDAWREGARSEDARLLDEERFNQLSARLELCAGANVLLIRNLRVPTGLLNGAQGTVVDIVYVDGTGPNSEQRAARMPRSVVVDFPFYEGRRSSKTWRGAPGCRCCRGQSLTKFKETFRARKSHWSWHGPSRLGKRRA